MCGGLAWWCLAQRVEYSVALPGREALNAAAVIDAGQGQGPCSGVGVATGYRAQQVADAGLGDQVVVRPGQNVGDAQVPAAVPPPTNTTPPPAHTKIRRHTACP